MNRLLLLYVILFLCVGKMAAQHEDAVLMTVAGKPVLLSEYLYAYHKNRSTTAGASADPSDYLNDYINYRLNVAVACEMGLDTLPAVRESLSGLSWHAGAGSEDTLQTVGASSSVVELLHIFLPLPQRASLEEERCVRMRMDSIWQVVQQGVDFAQLARICSPHTLNPVRVKRYQLLQELEDVAFTLAPGELSAPLLATDGFHLLKRLPDSAPEVGEGSTGLVAAPVRDSYLLNEYRNGILCHALYDRVLRNKAENDTVGIARYFEDHKRTYAWDIPHYKGLVFHCKDKKTLKQVRKLLKNCTADNWQTRLSQSQHDALLQKVRFGEFRLYRLSENPYVDELVFGGPEAPLQPDYPYAGVIGHELRKHPDDYRDVREAVTMDYQGHLEQKWYESLRKRFPVKVNEQVWKKVNIK